MTQTTTPPPASAAPPPPSPASPPVVRRRPDLGDPAILFAGLGTSLLAGLTGWFSLLSWRGMADEPSRYTGPLLTAALLIALVGWAVRRFTARPMLALLAQLVVLAVWVEHRLTGGLPRPSGFRSVWNELIDGAEAAQRYASPVSVTHSEFHFLLLLSGIGILLAVDFVVCGMRRASLGGLPLLLAITISASVLLEPVDWVVFLLTGFGWLALVAIQETDRAGSWGRGPAVRPRLTAVGGLAARIAVTCGLIAVVLSSALSSEGRTFGSFGQNGGNSSINVNNPMLDLRRNLVQGKDIPLVYVKTDDSAPSYLRTTVLDDFTGSSWQPTDRDFDSTSAIDGQLPPAPGLTSSAPVTSHNWQIRVSESFPSSWLPLPYPTGKLDVDDKWRYDPETLDVVGVGNTNASGLYLQRDRPLAAHRQHRASRGDGTAGVAPRPDDGPARRPPRGLPADRARGHQGREERLRPCRHAAGLVPQRRWFRVQPAAVARHRCVDPAEVHHQRPGRLLRAVLRRDGRHGPRR